MRHWQLSWRPWRGQHLRPSVVLKFLMITVLWFGAMNSLSTLVMADTSSISISGTEFIKDGAQWHPKGITVEAFVRPSTIASPLVLRMRAHWGINELIRAKNLFGIDTVRFQVSQPALDPKSTMHDLAYLGEVRKIVRQTRAAGFIVIVSPTAQDNSGLHNLPTLPDESTVRVWKSLAHLLKSDNGILFELFNEPNVHRGGWDAEAWSRWKATHQPVINAIRQAGARNVLLVDGLWYGRIINGAPRLGDPLSKTALAIHPYLWRGYDSVNEWTNKFGTEALVVPTMATEWNGTPNFGNCTPDLPAREAMLLSYLHKLGIGVIGWSLDHPGTLLENLTNWIPTNYQHFNTCHHFGMSGGGELFKEWRP
jgi:endoglucanase